MARKVKAAGKSASKSRRLSMHGSKPERSAMKNSAWLRTNAEKPRYGGWTKGASKRPRGKKG